MSWTRTLWGTRGELNPICVREEPPSSSLSAWPPPALSPPPPPSLVCGLQLIRGNWGSGGWMMRLDDSPIDYLSLWADLWLTTPAHINVLIRNNPPQTVRNRLRWTCFLWWRGRLSVLRGGGGLTFMMWVEFGAPSGQTGTVSFFADFVLYMLSVCVSILLSVSLFSSVSVSF